MKATFLQLKVTLARKRYRPVAAAPQTNSAPLANVLMAIASWKRVRHVQGVRCALPTIAHARKVMRDTLMVTPKHMKMYNTGQNTPVPVGKTRAHERQSSCVASLVPSSFVSCVVTVVPRTTIRMCSTAARIYHRAGRVQILQLDRLPLLGRHVGQLPIKTEMMELKAMEVKTNQQLRSQLLCLLPCFRHHCKQPHP